jgi:4-hydroxy-3-methylbut-2-enyl diphosphate reductase
VVSQTTTQVAAAEAVIAAIQAANPEADVRVVDTICSPTKARIAAVDALLPIIDALVVVGGHDSNNTKQLVARAERAGVPALHVESARELDRAWFTGRRVVGLTAGTSTLQRTIDEVHGWLSRCAVAAVALPAR